MEKLSTSHGRIARFRRHLCLDLVALDPVLRKRSAVTLLGEGGGDNLRLPGFLRKSYTESKRRFHIAVLLF